MINFDRWFEDCCREVMDRMGIALEDMPDWDWAGCYEDGMTSVEAVLEWITEEVPSHYD